MPTDRRVQASQEQTWDTHHYFCAEAFDGITTGAANGWAYGNSGGGVTLPAWVEFTLGCTAEEVDGLTILSGVGRSDHRIDDFAVELRVDGVLKVPTNIRVANARADLYCNGCDETMRGAKDSGYRGCQAKTKSGRTCQKWTSQSPHSFTNTPGKVLGMGLGDHNYCRNPDGGDTIWCYTMDSSKRWEYCDPLPLSGGHYSGEHYCTGLQGTTTFLEGFRCDEGASNAWTVIDASKGCQFDPNLAAQGITRTGMGCSFTLATCKAACKADTNCAAIDFFSTSKCCSKFNAACTSPGSHGDGPSSHRLTRREPELFVLCIIFVNTIV